MQYGVSAAGRRGLRGSVDFRSGTVPAAVSVSRASGGTAIFESAFIEYSNNVPRIDDIGLLIEPTRTNSVVNPRMEGGATGSPGTAPTAWTVTSSAGGLTREIVGFGTENGMPYMDVRYYGTATDGAAMQIGVTTPGISAVAGEYWLTSIYFRLVGGSTDNFTNWHIRFNERQGTTILATGGSSTFSPPTAAPLVAQRVVRGRTLTSATVDNITPTLAFNRTSGASHDMTLRIGILQVERGSVGAPTTPILPPPGSPAASTRAAETATMAVPGPDRNVRLLVQDLGGAEWRTVAVTGGTVPLEPRTGQRAIRRAQVWEIGSLTAVQEAYLAVPI